MEEAEYFRLKSKLLELTCQEMNLNHELEKIRINKLNLLKEYGFDPNKKYNMDDEKFEIVEQTSERLM